LNIKYHDAAGTGIAFAKDRRDMDVLLKKYFWVVNLLVIAVCASFAGRAASHMIEGAYLTSEDTRLSRRRPSLQPTQKTRGKETDGIVRRNMFCSGCAPVEPTPPKPGESGP